MVAEGRMFQALRVGCGRAVVCTWCYWKSRDVIQAENLLLLSWFDRAQKDDISILYVMNFSHFTFISNLTVNFYLSEQRLLFFS